jgi:hypothetical protein
MPAEAVVLDDSMERAKALLATVPESLTALDLCDGDRLGGVQAYVRVRLGTGKYLSLCKHHYEKHELALVAQGWAVFEDARGQLSKVASPVASDGVA